MFYVSVKSSSSSAAGAAAAAEPVNALAQLSDISSTHNGHESLSDYIINRPTIIKLSVH